MREEGFAGDVETDIEIRRAPGEPRDEARNPRPRDGAGDERMRRLEERLDQLLARINREGMSSLSAAEKDFLKQMSKRP